MDGLSEIINNCSTSSGTLAVLIAMGAGFAFLWKQGKDSRLEMKESFKEMKESLRKTDSRIDDLAHEVTSMDRRLSDQIAGVDKRLYGIETMMHMKEGCMIKNDQYLKKAE